MDHPSAHLFGGRLDRTSAARRGSAAHHASAGQVRCVCVAVMMNTYYKKRKRVVQWSSPARPSRMAPQSGAIALTGDFRSPTSGPPPLVQGGPGWSSLVQGGPVGVQSGRAPLRADRTVRSARQAAGSNRGELKRSAAACGADRSGSPGAARRIPRLAGSGPGWTTPHWSKVVQGGPGWSRQRGVGGAQPIIPERCAIDAQCDSASIG